MKYSVLLLIFSFNFAHTMKKTCSIPDLHYAVFHAKVELAAKYLQENHDPNAHTRTGKTSIHYAALTDVSDFENVRQICQALKKSGVDLNAQDNRGFTALHSAAVQERPDLMVFLIELGIDPTITDKDGYTAGRLYMIAKNPCFCSEYMNKKVNELAHK